MDADEETVRAAIDKIRATGTIPLVRLIECLEGQVNELRMIEAEGEEY